MQSLMTATDATPCGDMRSFNSHPRRITPDGPAATWNQLAPLFVFKRQRKTRSRLHGLTIHKQESRNGHMIPL